MVLKRSPIKRGKTNATTKADVEFARIVRGRLGGACFAAGEQLDCSGYIQCCHVISRRYRATRWLNSNAVPMCAAHHMFFTHHPLEWRDFIEAKLPGMWDELREIALNSPPEKAADALVRLRGAA
jgi:hypothetical protein